MILYNKPLTQNSYNKEQYKTNYNKKLNKIKYELKKRNMHGNVCALSLSKSYHHTTPFCKPKTRKGTGTLEIIKACSNCLVLHTSICMCFYDESS